MKCCQCKKEIELAHMVGVLEETKHLSEKEYCESCFIPVAQKYGLSRELQLQAPDSLQIQDSP